MDLKARGLEVFNAMCDRYTEQSLNFKRDEENLTIYFTVNDGEEVYQYAIRVEWQREIITTYVKIANLTVPREKTVGFAMGIETKNACIVDGVFDFDVANATYKYRHSVFYHDAVLGFEIFDYIIACSSNTVINANKKVRAFVNGEIGEQEFIERMRKWGDG